MKKAEITVEPARHGYVRVTVEYRGRVLLCETWRMTEDEAREAAETTARTMGANV